MSLLLRLFHGFPWMGTFLTHFSKKGNYIANLTQMVPYFSRHFLIIYEFSIKLYICMCILSHMSNI